MPPPRARAASCPSATAALTSLARVSQLELLGEEERANEAIAFPIRLEQYLMVGSYNQVLEAKASMPNASFDFFMALLLDTVRCALHPPLLRPPARPCPRAAPAPLARASDPPLPPPRAHPRSAQGLYRRVHRGGLHGAVDERGADDDDTGLTRGARQLH